jgi:hypothetical protein
MTTAAARRMRLQRERVQRFRQREQAGTVCLVIEVPERQTIELLVEAKLLDARQDFFTRRELADAVAAFLLACNA